MDQSKNIVLFSSFTYSCFCFLQTKPECVRTETDDFAKKEPSIIVASTTHHSGGSNGGFGTNNGNSSKVYRVINDEVGDRMMEACDELIIEKQGMKKKGESSGDMRKLTDKYDDDEEEVEEEDYDAYTNRRGN